MTCSARPCLITQLCRLCALAVASDLTYPLSQLPITNPTNLLQSLTKTPGQAPYTGQATWFARFHPEKIQSAIDRYANEIVRVVSVLDKHLADTSREYLVGDKCTYADLSFVTWAGIGRGLLKQIGRDSEYERFPHYEAWMGRLEGREVVKGIAESVAEGRRAHGLP